MGRIKLKEDYEKEYPNDILFLIQGLSLRKVRAKTGTAINTLRKLKKIFHL